MPLYGTCFKMHKKIHSAIRHLLKMNKKTYAVVRHCQNAQDNKCIFLSNFVIFIVSALKQSHHFHIIIIIINFDDVTFGDLLTFLTEKQILFTEDKNINSTYKHVYFYNYNCKRNKPVEYLYALRARC